MGSGKTMLVSEMAQAVLKEDAPVCIEAFDGSTFGSEDADLQVRVTSPKAIYQLASNLNEIGLAAHTSWATSTSKDWTWPTRIRSCASSSNWHRTSESHLRSNWRAWGRPFSATATTRWRCRSPKAPRNSNASSPVCSRTPKKADSETVSFHYDLSNEFYADFIGPSMTYTCAVFDTPDMSLDDAQRNKIDLVLDKLDLKPGDRMLDIGCGWGALVIAAAKRGIKALGVSLSHEQIEYGQEWIRREGLENLAELRVMDYREVPERDFDGITSVGMMEHVGAKNYRHYFDEMFKLLKPAGRLLNHQITISKDKPNNRPGTDEFLDRYIFPDGDLASPGFIESALHDAGFEVVNQENLRQHYALTLHHWNANLKANWADAVKQVGYERAKVYGLYLAACELNFELNGIQVHQFLAVKTDKERLPKGNWYPLRPWWAA